MVYGLVPYSLGFNKGLGFRAPCSSAKGWGFEVWGLGVGLRALGVYGTEFSG